MLDDIGLPSPDFGITLPIAELTIAWTGLLQEQEALDREDGKEERRPSRAECQERQERPPFRRHETMQSDYARAHERNAEADAQPAVWRGHFAKIAADLPAVQRPDRQQVDQTPEKIDEDQRRYDEVRNARRTKQTEDLNELHRDFRPRFGV